MPLSAPSTVTFEILYPLSGVMVKVRPSPSFTVTAPLGEMVPPSFADAVMVCVTTGAGAVVTLIVNVFSYGVVAVKPPAITAFSPHIPNKEEFDYGKL